MKKRLRSFAIPLACSVIGATLLLGGCNSPKGDAAEGLRWYNMHNCSACHGPNGNDGRAAKISAIDMSFGAFVGILRDPYSPSMPRFTEKKISEKDAADIYAWLKSMPE
ncbi:c-type cytochrome [Desulfopila aestuarii]|uniref:Cytochrome C oxidase, cbb3-type, subunit III n=1 Tax=Desulfopila aestuarii DSM 18488 TaxID=1121416 RepID=A0A1M7YEJ4_9BACT|nr:cytochrome c [Desulfopila aestuarii]SHO51064.1 Cytochrome C oxidase, cbb3-type, subunit III [Desulfopila aestuarii DSM 18488]